jgi:hypothetical protein
MNDSMKFQRLTALSVLVAVPLAIASAVLLLAAGFDLQAVNNPVLMLTIGSSRASLLRWGMILDVFGYYLLLAPLTLYLWSWLKPHSYNLITLYTLCGLAYSLIGAMGAIVLSAVLPPLVNDYAQASPQLRETLQIVFSSFMSAVYLGLWNPLEALMFGIWMMGMGPFVQRERPALGIIMRVLGFFALMDAFGRFVNVDAIFLVGVAGMLLFPIWLPWIGIDLMRHPSKSQIEISNPIRNELMQ